jgi:hypothetical protein
MADAIDYSQAYTPVWDVSQLYGGGSTQYSTPVTPSENWTKVFDYNQQAAGGTQNQYGLVNYGGGWVGAGTDYGTPSNPIIASTGTTATGTGTPMSSGASSQSSTKTDTTGKIGIPPELLGLGKDSGGGGGKGGGVMAGSGGGGGSYFSGGAVGIQSYTPAQIPAYTAPAITPFTPAAYSREAEKPYYQQFMAPMMSQIKAQGQQAQEAINVSDNPNVKSQLMRAKMAGTGEAIAQAGGIAGKEAIGEARTDWQATQQAAQQTWMAQQQQQQQAAMMQAQINAQNVAAQNEASYRNMIASLQAAGMTSRSSGGGAGGYGTGGAADIAWNQ